MLKYLKSLFSSKERVKEMEEEKCDCPMCTMESAITGQESFELAIKAKEMFELHAIIKLCESSDAEKLHTFLGCPDELPVEYTCDEQMYVDYACKIVGIDDFMDKFATKVETIH